MRPVRGDGEGRARAMVWSRARQCPGGGPRTVFVPLYPFGSTLLVVPVFSNASAQRVGGPVRVLPAAADDASLGGTILAARRAAMHWRAGAAASYRRLVDAAGARDERAFDAATAPVTVAFETRSVAAIPMRPVSSGGFEWIHRDAQTGDTDAPESAIGALARAALDLARRHPAGT